MTELDEQNIEWLTNTADSDWKRWCHRDGAFKGRPQATEKLSVAEIEKNSYFGIYAPKQK